MNDPTATLHTIDGKPVLRFERRLAHPPEKVWRAVTDPAEMRHWFPAAVETELRVGASMRFSFEDALDHDGAYADGEILELDPPKVYAFRWVGDVLRFELLPDDAGCLLMFSFTLSGVGTEGDLPSVARTAPGWDTSLDGLAARLDGADAPRPDALWFLSRAEHYVERFGLGEGEVRELPDGFLIRFERDLMQPVDEVWEVLTGNSATATDTPPVRATNTDVPAGTVTEVAAPHVLEYDWTHDGTPVGRVRFELATQRPIGTRLVLTQTVPAHLADLRPTALAGWQTHLELLYAAAHGDIRCPRPADRTAHLRARYARALAR